VKIQYLGKIALPCNVLRSPSCFVFLFSPAFREYGTFWRSDIYAKVRYLHVHVMYLTLFKNTSVRNELAN
jgi:hypothetical protein